MSRNGWTHAVFSVALLALVSASASAETDVYASGVVRGKYLYNTDDEVDASVADTRVDLDIGIGALTLGAVYRAYLLSDDSYNPADVEAPPTEVKHRYVALEHDDLTVRAGHFFSTFGRGLTLRSYEDVDLEYDTVLDGLSMGYKVGDVSLTALSGIATDDEAGTAYTEHVVRAARASMPLTDWADVAGSVVERSRTAKDEDVELPDEIARFEDTVVGTELSVWAGPLTLAAEYAGRDGANPVTEASEIQGHATYAAATLSFDAITFFGEFKDYEGNVRSLVGLSDQLSQGGALREEEARFDEAIRDNAVYGLLPKGTTVETLRCTLPWKMPPDYATRSGFSLLPAHPLSSSNPLQTPSETWCRATLEHTGLSLRTRREITSGSRHRLCQKCSCVSSNVAISQVAPTDQGELSTSGYR